MPITPGNLSGTITSGGAAQALAPVNPNRHGMWVQNNSSGDLWVSDVGTASATQPSMKLEPGVLYVWDYATDAAVSIYGATTGQAFSAREW